jgi:hypothetical protein
VKEKTGGEELYEIISNHMTSTLIITQWKYCRLNFIIDIVVFWVLTPCSLVGGYHYFRETERPEGRGQYISLKSWYLLTEIHSDITQNTAVQILTTVEMPDLTNFLL